MKYVQSPLPGVWTIELDRLSDERGWFARTFDVDELRASGLEMEVVQCNAAFSPRRGTLRGMHYQADPHGETKLVRCVRGAVFHVAVDLRPRSPTYCGWHGIELSAENRRAMYLPQGVAHGCQTLVDECEVQYQMGERYVPKAARGVRWDDPAFAIEWPPLTDGSERILSQRDRSFADWGLTERKRSFASSPG
ncbi:MAG: dTDP-4-dehydrorhamnose 3,5-epimerase [Solirubrobacterales bacterium]|nr:dTDP-4-dehydrorhamnose 3,5-epimerase [Solirubrobacterales bacterium]